MGGFGDMLDGVIRLVHIGSSRVVIVWFEYEIWREKNGGLADDHFQVCF